MSILTDKTDPKSGRYVMDSANVIRPPKDVNKRVASLYSPTDEQKKCREEFITDFRNGWQTMHTPRAELNDYSLYQRHIVDMLSFNSYQQNDGQPMLEDRLGGWRSKAMRPLQRNKAISIAAHMTARQIVPKVFAYNESDESQEDSAKVMSHLTDWAREQANYPFMALYRTIAALYSPISWGYTEYVQVYRRVKDYKDEKGKWVYKQVLDEVNSGFKHTPAATDQVFFPNFYERDPQKQDFIIYRRIISFDQFQAKYPVEKYPDAVHVKPGVIVTLDDANTGFYDVVDSHMRRYEVEELIRWRKSTDSKEVMVNGVLITEPYAENPRMDHQYPWDCFYYLPINERCIAGKSLVFALGPESSLLNTQYQMINDANFLNLFPPTVTSGSDKAGVDVMIPGLNLAFAEADVKINTLRTATDNSIQTAMDVMENVEKSLAESSQDPIQQGQQNNGPASTAYEISRIEQNAATVLGLTMKFMANSHVIPFGRLLLSDILQYLTIADAEKITGEGGLIYKTFYVNSSPNGKKNKVQFDATMPDTMSEDEKLQMSFKLLIAQGAKSDTTLYKVNPILFRDYKYMFAIDSDVLNPRSAELERAFSLELYDRAINSPVANQETLFKDVLLSTDPRTARDPDKYTSKQPVTPQDPNAPVQGSVAKPNTPIQPDSRKPVIPMK